MASIAPAPELATQVARAAPSRPVPSAAGTPAQQGFAGQVAQALAGSEPNEPADAVARDPQAEPPAAPQAGPPAPAGQAALLAALSRGAAPQADAPAAATGTVKGADSAGPSEKASARPTAEGHPEHGADMVQTPAGPVLALPVPPPAPAPAPDTGAPTPAGAPPVGPARQAAGRVAVTETQAKPAPHATPAADASPLAAPDPVAAQAAAPPPAASLPPPTPTPVRDTAPASAPAPAPASSLSAQIAHAVAGPVQVVIAAPAHAGAPQTLTIHLQPGELGRVQVRIERSAEGPAKVELAVERPDTLLLLMRDQPQLQQALDQAGVPQDGRTVQFSLAADTPSGGGGALGGDGGGGQRPLYGQHGQGGGGAAELAGAPGPNPAWLRAGLDITA